MQASWFPFDVQDPDKRISDNSQRDETKVEDPQAAIDEWRTRLEAPADGFNKQHGRQAVEIVPAGDAVVKLRAEVVAGTYPGVSKQPELFRDPIGHGAPHIQALVAYCNFAAIYRISPEGLRTLPHGLTETQDLILQKSARDTDAGSP